MTSLKKLDRFLLSSTLGKTLLGPVVTTGAAVQLGLPADPDPSPLLVGRITLVVLVVCGTWYGVRRSELERAASEARSRDFENRFEALIDEATYRILERAERAEEAAVEALRSSLCGLEAQVSLPRFQGQCLESCFYTDPMKTNDHNEFPFYATPLQR